MVAYCYGRNNDDFEVDEVWVPSKFDSVIKCKAVLQV